MKKIIFIVVASVVMALVCSCSSTSNDVSNKAPYRVAMITDSGNITDRGFNQSTYEACKDFCGTYIPFKFFKPAKDSTTDRLAMIRAAADEGYNIIVTPGYVFGEALQQAAPLYPNVKFVAPDVSADSLGGKVPSNVYSMTFCEEIAGFCAGYAAVKIGYENLGFVGGSQVPAVIRYGKGFLQGAELASKEDNKKVSVRYCYANSYFGSSDITKSISLWYKSGVQCVFSCGGGLFTSVAEAASKNGGKIIGVDVDQASIIDDAYGRGITVTSATKGLYAAVISALYSIIENGIWDRIAGQSVQMGIVSESPERNYVGIPMGSGTQFCDTFTEEDYKNLVGRILRGDVKISSSLDEVVALTNDSISVNYDGVFD